MLVFKCRIIFPVRVWWRFFEGMSGALEEMLFL
jgi:hypothetical protein